MTQFYGTLSVGVGGDTFTWKIPVSSFGYLSVGTLINLIWVFSSIWGSYDMM